MKKLFASLLAATMVAGMAVSAFADTDIAADQAANKMAAEEYTLMNSAYYDDTKVIDNAEVFGGNSIYYPILVQDEDHPAVFNFATKASDVDGVTAKVKVKMGKEYVEKDAKIVKTNPLEKTGDKFTGKVYCVEIKLNDYFKTIDSEVEVEVSLYHKGRKQVTTADDVIAKPATVFTLGYEPEKLDANSKDAAAKTGNVVIKKVKDKDGAIELKINKDTKAVALKKYISTDGNKQIEIEDITLLPGTGAPNFEYTVKASEQGALWLEVNSEVDKEIVTANQDADVNFFNFPGTPEFDFNGTLKLFVDDTEKTYFCYAINDGKVTPVGKYNAEDECFEIKTNKLGSYVLADKELVNAKEEKPADKPAEEKPADKVVGTGAIA